MAVPFSRSLWLAFVHVAFALPEESLCVLLSGTSRF